MSYAEELKAHYKAVRDRLRKNGKPEPRELTVLLRDEKPEPVADDHPDPGLVTKEQNASVVTRALAAAMVYQPDYKHYVLSELDNAPMLPPLPGLVLNEIGAVRWMRLLHAVAKMHNISPNDILGTSRMKHIVSARFELFYRMRYELGMSYTKIGVLTKRDHSSVLHGVWKIRQKLLDAKVDGADDGGSDVGNTHSHQDTLRGQSSAFSP